MAECRLFPVIDLTGTGRSIERCRKAAGLSVRDVQAYFGFEYPQAVYKWQHGECLPSVDNLLALARLLQVKMEDLLVYEDLEVPLFLGTSFFRAYLFSSDSRNPPFKVQAVSLFFSPFHFLAPKRKKAPVTSGSMQSRSLYILFSGADRFIAIA